MCISPILLLVKSLPEMSLGVASLTGPRESQAWERATLGDALLKGGTGGDGRVFTKGEKSIG